MELFVRVVVRGKTSCLVFAEGEDTEGGEGLMEEVMDAVLEGFVEVDEDVATEDEVELVEWAVCDEVVLSEEDVFFEGGVEGEF